MDFKVILVILKDKCIEETKIGSVLRISMKVLQKSLNRLIELGLIRRMRQKQTHLVNIILGNRFCDVEECVDCKYAHRDSSGFYRCSIEKSIYCLHDYERLSHGIHRIMKETHEEIKALEDFKRKVGKGGVLKDDVDRWNFKDFIIFYLEQFKVHYPDAIAPTDKVFLRKSIKELYKTFKERSGNRWRYLMKHYISKTMSLCVEENIILNPNKLNDPIFVKGFLSSKGLKIMNLGYCNVYDILCSYALRDGVCSLDKSNIECDSELIERMKERYN